MARLVTLISITAALAVSPTAYAFKKAEPVTPAPAAAPAPTPTPEQPAPAMPTAKEQAGRGQGATPQAKPVAPAVPAMPVAVPQPPAAKASPAPVVRPAEVPRRQASAPAQKAPVAPATPPSQVDAQRQLDAELAKLKALQEREAAKIKAMPADPFSQKGGAVSRESRDYLKGLKFRPRWRREMNAREGFVGVVVQVHPTDFRYLVQAAAAMKTDIEEFAALAIYKQSKAALYDMAVPKPAAGEDIKDDDGTVPRASA